MKALIIVDVQNDFCEGGSLGVKSSAEIFAPINQLKNKGVFEKVILTKDWHPIDHVSFAVNHQKQPFSLITLNGEEQVLWPVHCVQGEVGSQLSKLIEISGHQVVILKGFRPNEEAYSGFGTSENPTELNQLLKKEHIEEVYIVGLALDYCVGNTAIDAAKNGFKTYVIAQATRPVSKQTGEDMKKRFTQKGVNYIRLSELNF